MDNSKKRFYVLMAIASPLFVVMNVIWYIQSPAASHVLFGLFFTGMSVLFVTAVRKKWYK